MYVGIVGHGDEDLVSALLLHYDTVAARGDHVELWGLEPVT